MGDDDTIEIARHGERLRVLERDMKEMKMEEAEHRKAMRETSRLIFAKLGDVEKKQEATASAVTALAQRSHDPESIAVRAIEIHEERRKQSTKGDPVISDPSTLLIRKIPWKEVGYLIASVAAAITAYVAGGGG